MPLFCSIVMRIAVLLQDLLSIALCPLPRLPHTIPSPPEYCAVSDYMLLYSKSATSDQH